MGGECDWVSTETRVEAAPARRAKRSLFSATLGVVGELLITAGVLLLLFIVWEIWWTDIGAHRQQAAAVEQIYQEWKAPNPLANDAQPKIGAPRFDDPPQSAPVANGEAMGILRIPRFGLDNFASINEGTSLDILNTGAVGHYHDSQQPGEIGNFAVAGHRQTYGAPLKDVANLQEGDAIIVETPNAYLIYKMTEHYIVWPSESDVILPVPRQPGVEPTQRILTLTTCHPPFVSNQRWIVHATFDHWVDKNDGIPEELTKEVG